MKLTVFTPTYNRIHTLPRTYESLCRQTRKDFVWLIVDDGSTDGTADLVAQWVSEGMIPIEYYYKKNGGMASAHNEAYKHINTMLAVCIDSDDWMPDDGVEAILSEWEKRGNSGYAGIIGLDLYEDSSVVGTAFPAELEHCKVRDMVRKYKVYGDKKYVYRVDVMKQYLPYVEFEGERFGGVNYLYQVIDIKYDMLCTNLPFCIVEYQPDGMSANLFLQYRNSPKTYMQEREMLMTALSDKRDKFRHAIHYVSSALFAKDLGALFRTKNLSYVLCAIPFGVLLNVYIRIKLKRSFSVQ